MPKKKCAWDRLVAILQHEQCCVTKLPEVRHHPDRYMFRSPDDAIVVFDNVVDSSPRFIIDEDGDYIFVDQATDIEIVIKDMIDAMPFNEAVDKLISELINENLTDVTTDIKKFKELLRNYFIYLS